MKNYLGAVAPITVLSDGTHVSGAFVVIGGIYGVTGIDVVVGDNMPLHTEGVFTLPKTTSEAWVAGERLFWNTSTKKFTIDATKLPVNAVAAAIAGSADATGPVALGLGEGGLKFIAGQATTATASDTIVTGLTRLAGVVVQFDDNPGDDPNYVSGSIGDQAGTPAAGSFLLKSWKNTSGSDPTPLAAATFSKKVNYIAFGY